MSWPRALVRSDLDGPTKLVGLALATHSRREGALRVGASVGRLAIECAMSGPAVMRCLHLLHASGFVEPLDAAGEPTPLTFDTREYRLTEPPEWSHPGKIAAQARTVGQLRSSPQ